MVPSKRPRTKRGQSKPEVEIGVAPNDVAPKDTTPNVHSSLAHAPQQTASPLAAPSEDIQELVTENIEGASGDSAAPEQGPPPVRFLICDSARWC